MIVLAFLTDPEVVRKILTHLKLPTLPPPVARPRVTGSALALPLSAGEGMASDGEEDDAAPVLEERNERPPP